MLELARKTSLTLREFMDWVDEFVNSKDTFKVLVGSRQKGKRNEKRVGQMDKMAELSQQGRRPERQPNRNPRLIHNTL